MRADAPGLMLKQSAVLMLSIFIIALCWLPLLAGAQEVTATINGTITDPAGSPWPGGFYWIAADNSHVAMDAPTLYAFGRAVAAYVSACVLTLRAIKDAIAAATDQATLDAIDVAAGYPTASA